MTVIFNSLAVEVIRDLFGVKIIGQRERLKCLATMYHAMYIQIIAICNFGGFYAQRIYIIAPLHGVQ